MVAGIIPLPSLGRAAVQTAPRKPSGRALYAHSVDGLDRRGWWSPSATSPCGGRLLVDFLRSRGAVEAVPACGGQRPNPPRPRTKPFPVASGMSLWSAGSCAAAAIRTVARAARAVSAGSMWWIGSSVAGARRRASKCALLRSRSIANEGCQGHDADTISLSACARPRGRSDRSCVKISRGLFSRCQYVKARPMSSRLKDPVAVTGRDRYVPNNKSCGIVEAPAQVLQGKGGRQSQAIVRCALVRQCGAAAWSLPRLSTGTLVVSDREVKLSGDALYEAAAVQIRAGLGKDFPQGWQFKPEISVRPAAAPVDASVCQQLFADLLAKAKIRFESGRATIDPDSVALLDRLVETAMRCPAVNIEISGHTDADGEAALTSRCPKGAHSSDRFWSRPPVCSRFTPIGYGSTQPLGSNDTTKARREPSHRFVVRKANDVSGDIPMGWLLASLLPVSHGLDRGGSSRPERVEGDRALAGGPDGGAGRYGAVHSFPAGRLWTRPWP